MTDLEKARSIMRRLIAEHAARSSDKWRGSDFNIESVEKGLRGDVGEDFVVDILSYLGYNAKRKTGHRGEYDIEANGYYIEVKTASEDVHQYFQFNSIRYDVDYDFLFLVGIAPNDIFFRIYKKDMIPKNLASMAKGTPGTYKFTHSSKIAAKRRVFNIQDTDFAAYVKKYLGIPKT